MADYSLMVAPNGARRGHADHAQLPMTTDEIAVTAAACHRAGAGALHLHVRDDLGQHSLDAGRYREAMAAVAEAAPEMAIQITTESAGLFTPTDQIACLQALQPGAASIAIREMAADPEIARRTYAFCAEAGIEVQHILYGSSCAAQLGNWIADGTVSRGHRRAIFVLGQYVPPVLGSPEMLFPFLPWAESLNLKWSACAFGRTERACLLSALEAGGNVRIGFENNIETPDGRPLRDNAESVATFVEAASQAGHALTEGY